MTSTVRLLSLLLLVGLHGCALTAEGVPARAVSKASSGFCDPDSEEFAARKQKLAWQPVPDQRIAEADYYGRTFEARLRGPGEDSFAYKVIMNAGGGPAFVSVALLDHPQEIIDVEQLAVRARMLLQNEALNVVREQRIKEAYPLLVSNRNDISLWSQGAGWYFAVETQDRFSVFEIAGSAVRYLCTQS